MVTPRASHSIMRLSRVSTIVVSPYSFVIAIGVPETPQTWKVSIWSSGNARPMPSASTTGSPSLAPTTRGMVELRPPHSIGIVAYARRPRYDSSARSEATTSCPAGIFSTTTVGAPIIAVGMMSASSGTSSSDSSVTSPPPAMASSTISRPMYGSPPPPVPRKAAPRARSTMSWRTSRRATRSDSRPQAEALLDRDVLDVVAEVAGADEGQSLWRAPAGVARRRDHRDPEAISQLLGRDRLAGLGIEDDDQVRYRGDDLSVADRDQVLVLEADAEDRPGILADALDARLALGEARLRPPLDVGDLATEDPEPAQPVQDGLDRVAVGGPCLADQPPQLLRQAQRAGYHRLLELPSGQRVERDHGGCSHVDRDRARQPLGPPVVDRLDEGDVALLVGQRHRRRRHPEHGRRHHLDLRERPAHPVTVDQRDAHLRGYSERRRRVEAPGLDGNGVGDLSAQVPLQRLEGADDLVAARELLDHHGGRAHHGRGHDQRIV